MEQVDCEFSGTEAGGGGGVSNGQRASGPSAHGNVYATVCLPFTIQINA